MILITGASGFIGRNLVKELVKKGKKVRCLVRSKPKLEIFNNSNVSIAYGDMTNPDSLIKASKDCKTVIHLAAMTSEKPSDYKSSYNINVEGAKNLVKACEKNKIARLIVISTQSTKRKIKGAYGKTKQLADEIFLKSNLNLTTLKPTLVYGKDSKGLFSKILGFVKKLPVIPIIGTGKYRNQPIYVKDVCAAIISCLENKKTYGKIYDLAGKDRIGFEKFLDTIMDELNIKKKKVHVPYTLTMWGTHLLSLFIKNPPITKDNLLGLIQETTVDLQPAKKDFGFNPLGIREGIRASFFDTDKLKAVVIGMGKMGILHASILNKIDNVDVVAFMDKSKKLRTYVNTIGIDAVFFDSAEKMIERVKPDLAFVCTPPFLNSSIVELLAKNNVHAFIEKPMSDSLEGADKIKNAVKKHNINLTVGYHVNFLPIVKKAKQILDDKILGKISDFDSRVYLSQVFSPKKGWRYDKKTSGGGVTIIVASHIIFILHLFFNQVRSVRSKLKYPYSNVEDESYTNFEFSNKIKGNLEASWSKKGYERVWFQIHIKGSDGTLMLTNESIILSLKKSKGKYNAGKTIIHKSDITDEESFKIGGTGYYEQDNNFINKILKNPSKSINVDQAYEVQKIIDAIYESGKTNNKITIR